MIQQLLVVIATIFAVVIGCFFLLVGAAHVIDRVLPDDDDDDTCDCGGNPATAQQPPLTATGHWLLAMSGPLGWTRNDGFRGLLVNHRPEAMREALAESWGIHDRADALRLLAWLRDVGHQRALEKARAGTSNKAEYVAWAAAHPEVDSIVAFDWVRVAGLARSVFSVDFISEEEAWDWLRVAGDLIKARFNSWDELAQNYALGDHFWDGDDSDPDRLESLRTVYQGHTPALAGLLWNQSLDEPPTQP